MAEIINKTEIVPENLVSWHQKYKFSETVNVTVNLYSALLRSASNALGAPSTAEKASSSTTGDQIESLRC